MHGETLSYTQAPPPRPISFAAGTLPPESSLGDGSSPPARVKRTGSMDAKSDKGDKKKHSVFGGLFKKDKEKKEKKKH